MRLDSILNRAPLLQLSVSFLKSPNALCAYQKQSLRMRCYVGRSGCRSPLSDGTRSACQDTAQSSSFLMETELCEALVLDFHWRSYCRRHRRGPSGGGVSDLIVLESGSADATAKRML